MGKLVMLILLGAVAWGAWEIHNKGVHGAFDGALAPSAAATDDDKEALATRPTRISPLAQEAPIPGVD